MKIIFYNAVDLHTPSTDDAVPTETHHKTISNVLLKYNQDQKQVKMEEKWFQSWEIVYPISGI